MKVLNLFLLLALCIAFVKSDGTAYEVTNYGGSDDKNTHLNPRCYRDGRKSPSTDYYGAVSLYDYDYDLCDSYAVIMGVTLDDNPNVGNMVKVAIIDSCRECAESHIDISKIAFNYIGEKDSGHFQIIWVAATKEGKVTRNVIYPSSQTEKFAKKQYGLSKDKFVSMFKEQALKMIKNDSKHGKFDKYAVPKTTTTRKTTTTTTTTKRTTTTTTTVKTTSHASHTTHATQEPTVTKTTEVTEAAETTAVETAPAVIGDVDIVLGENNDNTIPEDAPIVGESEALDPNKINYTPEDIKILEEHFPDKEEGVSGNYTVGIFSSLSITGAAGIGLLYLKKKNPSKYDDLKQKFPEAFNTIKRSVTRSATSIRRGVTRTATSIRRKNNTEEVSRHGNHEGYNYREMPEHMFGEDGLPRIQLHDDPVSDFPEATIKLN